MDKETLERDARRAIAAGRTNLVRGPFNEGVSRHAPRPQDAFFAVLAMKLDPVAAWWVPTMATDGKRLFYNPDFTLKLSWQEVVGVLAHECMHPALGHLTRMRPQDGYDHELANVAQDLAINCLLLDDGYVLPPGCCVPGVAPFRSLPPRKNSEWYYMQLLKEKESILKTIRERCDALGIPEPGEGPGRGRPQAIDPGGCGGIVYPSEGGTEVEHEWRENVAQAAAAARGIGKLPSGVERLIDAVVEPKVPWQDVLRDYVRRHARNDYTWTRPNRRYVAQDIYLPGMHSDDLGEIVVGLDTSGSCYSPEVLGAFLSELRAIIEGVQAKVWLMECDAAVHRVTEWEPGTPVEKLELKGGGGTSHVPIWEEVERRGIDPSVAIMLTDGYTSHGMEQEFPVVWCYKGNETKAPWGATVHMD